MRDLIAKIDDETDKPIIGERRSLSGFRYENGYTLSCTDLGKNGVKVELVHKHEGSGAIILPPGKTKEYGRWLLQTISQRNHNPSKELAEILKRLINEKKLNKIFKRGDKKKVRDALNFLKSTRSKN